MYKQAIETLRQQVLTDMREGASLRHAIQETRGRARYDAWNDKRSGADDRRYNLLAYAFARGVPYRAAEPMTETPSDVFYGVMRRLLEVLPGERDQMAADLKVWLDTPETPARLERRTRAVEAAQLRWEARRAGHRRSAAA